MTAKEYLTQVRKLKILIEQREKELRQLTDQKLGAVSGIDYSRIPVKGSRRVGASFEQAAVQSLDLTEEIAGLIRDYTELKHRIIGEIQQLDKPEYMQVLYKRYVEEKRWEEISAEMNYNCDYIRRLHGRALQQFGNQLLQT